MDVLGVINYEDDQAESMWHSCSPTQICLPSAPVYPGRTQSGQDPSEDTELLFIETDTTALLYVLNGF